VVELPSLRLFGILIELGRLTGSIVIEFGLTGEMRTLGLTGKLERIKRN